MTIRMLLCTDKSRNALAAISMGGRVASALGAETTLLAAGRSEPAVRKALSAALEVLGSFGIAPKPLARIGPFTGEFIDEICRGEYHLAVIGYRKRSALEKALQGCVAARVANQATTSVMIVREGRPDIRRLLVGVGGNGFTDEMVNWASRLASAMGAHVTLMHVESAPPLMYAGLAEVHQTLTELLQTDTPAARALRQAAATLDAAGIAADIKLVHGVTDRELLRATQEGDYDLLIVGSAWALPPITRLMLPNVTLDVLLKTRRPVLVVYPDPF